MMVAGSFGGWIIWWCGDLLCVNIRHCVARSRISFKQGIPRGSLIEIVLAR
jgi:hypothetical protein